MKMLESALTLWQAIVGLLVFVTPGIIGVSKLFTRVSILEAKDQAKDGVLKDLKEQQTLMARDITEVKTMLSEMKGFVEHGRYGK